MSAVLNLLLSHHFKAREIGDAKGGRYRDVRGVTTAAHDNTADAGMVVTRVYRVPTASQKDLEPGAEIHWIDIDRNADVAEIAGAIARGNVHAAAERDGEMGEVAADADAFVHGIAGAAGWTRIGIAEADLRVNEIADRLHDPAPPDSFPNRDQAKSASLSLSQYRLEIRNSSTSSGRSAMGVVCTSGGVSSGSPRVVNDEAIGECDKAGGNLDARDAIAEKIDIGAHRKRRIGVDPVGREQVSVTRGMDVELKEHRRLGRTFKCDVEARFDQHEP